MLHVVVRWLCRRAIRWFYRDAHILHAEHIPAVGPTLIIASHGNDLTDILMTFLLSRRDLLFVANMAAADSLLIRWVYRGLGVIPVSRVRDARALIARGADASAINARAFVRVVDALKAGQAVAIFPEGNVNDAPHLGLLRNGAAKMALQAVEGGVDLTMVAVGYQYESPTTPRSGLLAVVGNPVRVAEWKPVNATKAVTEFTKCMRHELLLVTRNARTQADAEILAKVAAAAGAARRSGWQSPMASAHDIQLALSQRSSGDGIFVANATAHATANATAHAGANSAVVRTVVREADGIADRTIARSTDHTVDYTVDHTIDQTTNRAIEHTLDATIDHATSRLQFERAAVALSDACAKLGAAPWSARDCADVLLAARDDAPTNSPSGLVWLVLTFPLAVVAWGWHALPLWAAYRLALRFAPLRVEIAARTIVPGLYIICLWYLAAPLALLTLGVSRWVVLAFFLAQPRFGDFAFGWRDRWRRWWLQRRVRHLPAAVRRSLAAQGFMIARYAQF